MVTWKYDVAVVGAGGRVGLPLSLVLVERGFRTVGLEIDKEKLQLLNRGQMPFYEREADEILSKHIVGQTGQLMFIEDYSMLADCESIIIVPGTPLTNDHTPDTSQIRNVLESAIKHIRPNHLIILRSTVSPGTTDQVREYLKSNLSSEVFDSLDITFAPERLLQGHAMKELYELPQIVGAYSERGYRRVAMIFEKLGVEVLHVKPIEAELSKLFANNFRYIQFAIANEFFSICESLNVNFGRVREATNFNYSRSTIPYAGYVGGPCLGKDAWLLIKARGCHPSQSRLISSAYEINENLPEIAIQIAKKMIGTLNGKTVLVLGITFKRDSDDTRESPVHRLLNLTENEFVGNLVIHDPFAEPEDLTTKVATADVIFVGTNHSQYDDAAFLEHAKPDCLIVDIWYQLNPHLGHAYFVKEIG